MSTLETTTQFPVDPGTVVEVTCSETGAINTGSSEVTCTFDTYFTYQQEPNCVIPGKLIAHLLIYYVNNTCYLLLQHNT